MKKEEGRGGDRIADIYKFMKEREDGAVLYETDMM